MLYIYVDLLSFRRWLRFIGIIALDWVSKEKRKRIDRRTCSSCRYAPLSPVVVGRIVMDVTTVYVWTWFGIQQANAATKNLKSWGADKHFDRRGLHIHMLLCALSSNSDLLKYSKYMYTLILSMDWIWILRTWLNTIGFQHTKGDSYNITKMFTYFTF